jgi:hypothetical protein
METNFSNYSYNEALLYLKRKNKLELIRFIRDENQIQEMDTNMDYKDKIYKFVERIKSIYKLYPLSHKNVLSESKDILFVDLDCFIPTGQSIFPSEKFSITGHHTVYERSYFGEKMFPNIKCIRFFKNHVEENYYVDSQFLWVHSIEDLLREIWSCHEVVRKSYLKKTSYKSEGITRYQKRISKVKMLAKNCVFQTPILVGNLSKAARVFHNEKIIWSVNSWWSKNISKATHLSRLHRVKDLWFCIWNFRHLGPWNTPSDYRLENKCHCIVDSFPKEESFYKTLELFTIVLDVGNKVDFRKLPVPTKLFIIWVLFNIQPKNFCILSYTKERDFSSQVVEMLGGSKSRFLYRLERYEHRVYRQFFLMTSCQLIRILCRISSEYELSYGNFHYKHLSDYLRKVSKIRFENFDQIYVKKKYQYMDKKKNTQSA